MRSREKKKENRKSVGVKDIVPDFDRWPKSWMGTEEDLGYGKKLLPVIEK